MQIMRNVSALGGMGIREEEGEGGVGRAGRC